MKISQLGTVLFSDSPKEDAAFFVKHFGFVVTAELDFYVSLKHEGLQDLSLDFLHEEGHALHNTSRPDVLLALVVDDAQAEKQRLEGMGATIVKPITDEPWGQRRFRIKAPRSIVEIVQPIPPDAKWMKSMGLA